MTEGFNPNDPIYRLQQDVNGLQELIRRLQFNQSVLTDMVEAQMKQIDIIANYLREESHNYERYGQRPDLPANAGYGGAKKKDYKPRN